MNKYLAILLLGSVLPLFAQSNRPSARPTTNSAARPVFVPTSPVQIQLTSLSNKVAALELKVRAFTRKQKVESDRYQLRLNAGQVSQNDSYVRARQQEEEQKHLSALSRDIAALKLQKFELRQRHRLPQPASPKRKR